MSVWSAGHWPVHHLLGCVLSCKVFWKVVRSVHFKILQDNCGDCVPSVIFCRWDVPGPWCNGWFLLKPEYFVQYVMRHPKTRAGLTYCRWMMGVFEAFSVSPLLILPQLGENGTPCSCSSCCLSDIKEGREWLCHLWVLESPPCLILAVKKIAALLSQHRKWESSLPTWQDEGRGHYGYCVEENLRDLH